MTKSNANIFECNDISVSYGNVKALQNIDVAFERGKIHAVVGQNGAGKTTFARVVAGLVSPQEGEIKIEGESVEYGSVSRVRSLGVELVHQSFALPPSFTVAEAMQFGAPKGGLFSKRSLRAKWQPHLDRLNIKVEAHQKIQDLPVETQQGVEIARALITNAKLLILDEPTAVLSPESTLKLFDRIRHLKQHGVTVILILHKIKEVLAISDTVSILRGGKLILTPTDRNKIDEDKLSDLIIGESIAKIKEPQQTQKANDVESILTLIEASTKPMSGDKPLNHVSLNVKPNEIIGLAGVEGNGQRSLINAISDITPLSRGVIKFNGDDITKVPLLSRREAGLRIIPFERNSEGLSLTSAIWENWAIRKLLQNSIFSAIKPKAIRQECADGLNEWSVKYGSVLDNAGSLSGGNAQKIILSREMDDDAKLILAAQPSRGLDIGAMNFVWKSLLEAKNRGCGVIFVSSDLDELFDISDRIVVMLSGRIAAEFRPPYDIKKVGAAMIGSSK